jgi:Domain of unknown function (DUF4334)/GXWXG protein
MSESRKDLAAGRAERLQTLEHGAPLGAALDFYDALPSVRVEEMLGHWRGSGVPTGNPLDGLLERFGWHGKRFDGPEAVHPLVFDDGRGGLVSVNPGLIPLPLVLRFARRMEGRAVARLSRAALPLLRTGKPGARLRMTEYRGVVSATMCYDALPINDVFRKVDDDTMLGAMDARGMESPFLFVLRRES